MAARRRPKKKQKPQKQGRYPVHGNGGEASVANSPTSEPSSNHLTAFLGSTIILPSLYAGYDQISEGRLIWALGIWALVPIGVLLVLRNALMAEKGIRMFRLFLGVYLLVALSVSGVVAFYELRSPTVITDRPDFHARIQYSLQSKRDHLFLQVLLFNSGLPSFASGYTVDIKSTTGSVESVVATLIPEAEELRKLFRNDAELVSAAERHNIHPRTDLVRRTLEPVGEEIVAGWILFLLPEGGGRIFDGDDWQITMRFYDRLNNEVVTTAYVKESMDPELTQCHDLSRR